jgi:hypothetical protein
MEVAMGETCSLEMWWEYNSESSQLVQWRRLENITKEELREVACEGVVCYLVG